jgi:hypothetical protein
VAIDFSALGTPVDGDDLSPSFGDLIHQANGNGLQWAKSCLPIVTSNPVQCRTTGNVIVGQNQLSANASGCMVSTPIYSVDPRTQGSTTAGVCTGNLSVGKATLVIGSVYQHAQQLAELMGDTTYSQTQGSYSVACSVDIETAISFRELTFALKDSDSVLGPITSRFQVSGDKSSPCTPLGGEVYPGNYLNDTITSYQQPVVSLSVPQFLTDNALAYSASASWSLLNENRYADGSLTTLFDSAGVHYWSNTQNALESRLGLASAMALGMFWGNIDSELYNEGVYIGSGTAKYTGTKLGPESWWSVFYISPCLFSIIVISYLLYVTRRKTTR